jgi:integrase
MARTQCFAEKRGAAWRGRYPDADGRMRSTSGYPTRAKALQAAWAERARIEDETARNAEEAKRAAKGETTVAEWIAEIWPAWDIELTTRANYSAPIRRFILPAFGDRPLASLRREEIDAWERALINERGYSVEYIRGARRRLHTILADAVTAGRLQVNPATRRRGRGRKASQDRAYATAEKVWAAEDDAVLLAERCGLLAGEAEFTRVLLMAFTGLRWGETVGLQASYIRGPDRRRSHSYIRVEWQMIELNGKMYLAPPKEGSRRDVDIPRWLSDLLQRLTAQARRCRCPRRDDGTSACGSREPFVFLGAEAGHARRSNYAARVFRPAADGIHPAQKRRHGYHTGPWRVHCSLEPFPGIPVPVAGIHRAKAEQVAECCWAPLITGLTPHGLRHGHQTAMRRDRVPRVLRRDRLGHGSSGDIADHYTHIGDEMIEDMLACLTRRWQAAVTARARIDQRRGSAPSSAVPALDEWLARFRERPGEIQLPSALPPAPKRGAE